MAQGTTVNEVLDVVVDAANIIVDLHEVGEYDKAKVDAAEIAVEACLHTIENALEKTEGRFDVKATTGPVGIKAGNLLSAAVSASLRSVGIRCANLGKTQTALELLRNSEEMGVDLVVPLLPDEGVEGQLQSFTEELERGGFKTKFTAIPVAPGLPENFQTSLPVARNTGEVISKATEWALKRKNQKK
jgi:hypothetical protein